MRELKFRAWHPEWGEMVKSSSGTVFEKREFYPFGFEVGFSHYPKSDGWIIMQYTGLKDRDGKEVCEGDLLRGDDGPPFEVVYHNGSFKLQWSYEMSDGRIERSYTGIDAMSALLTIVGNIHENPELLKEAQ